MGHTAESNHSELVVLRIQRQRKIADLVGAAVHVLHAEPAASLLVVVLPTKGFYGSATDYNSIRNTQLAVENQFEGKCLLVRNGILSFSKSSSYSKARCLAHPLLLVAHETSIFTDMAIWTRRLVGPVHMLQRQDMVSPMASELVANTTLTTQQVETRFFRPEPLQHHG